MNEVVIRKVLPKDLNECFLVEMSGFPPEEAASYETIKLHIQTFPEGFWVAGIWSSLPWQFCLNFRSKALHAD